MRTILLLPLLASLLWAKEGWDLSNPPKSSRAKTLRQKAQRLWEQAQPVCSKALTEKDAVSPDELAAAVEKVEEAVRRFERSLAQQWDLEANRALCEAIKAWYATRPLLPKAPEPAGEKERQRAAQEAARARRKRLQAARKYIMDYGRARRYGKQVKRCPRCEGRRDLRSRFGDIAPCPVCDRTGTLIDRIGVVKARWLFHSPFYRADGRRQAEINRSLRLASADSKRLAPFVSAFAIAGRIEDHDTWVRIRTKEKLQQDPHSKKAEKKEGTYVLYRVGGVWYLYEAHYDEALVDVPLEPEAEKKG